MINIIYYYYFYFLFLFFLSKEKQDSWLVTTYFDKNNFLPA